MKFKSAKDWSLATGMKITNFDGWDYDGTDIEKKISLDEFKNRIKIKKRNDNMENVIELARKNLDEVPKPVYPDSFMNTIPEIVYDPPAIPYNVGTLIDREDFPTVYELMGKPKPAKDPYLVLIIDGGTGDNVVASVMIEMAKKTYPEKKIIVGAIHPELLENNPNIDKLYHLAEPDDMYETYVKDLKHFGSVLKRDIYNVSAHKTFPGTLSMIWCYLYGIPYHKDNPQIYLTEKEDTEAKKWLSSFDKPVIFIQCYGARLTFDPEKGPITTNKDWNKESWVKLVKYLSKNYYVIQLGGRGEEQIPGCAWYMLGGCSLRQSAALIKNCLTYVTIDSFTNHVGASVGKPGIVLFGRSNPVIAGHTINKNLYVPDSCIYDNFGCGRPMGYFGDSERSLGAMRPWLCPERTCMKALTPEIVYDQTIKLIKEIESKNVKEQYSV